jgi:hypothetical protein
LIRTVLALSARFEISSGLFSITGTAIISNHSCPLGGLEGESIMKRLLVGIALVLSFAAAPASAQKMNADDIKWVNQCIDDSKGEPGATPAIARKYCICMNEKMDDNETQSITQWEKTHRKEREACDKEAGWK